MSFCQYDSDSAIKLEHKVKSRMFDIHLKKCLLSLNLWDDFKVETKVYTCMFLHPCNHVISMHNKAMEETIQFR